MAGEIAYRRFHPAPEVPTGVTIPNTAVALRIATEPLLTDSVARPAETLLRIAKPGPGNSLVNKEVTWSAIEAGAVLAVMLVVELVQAIAPIAEERIALEHGMSRAAAVETETRLEEVPGVPADTTVRARVQVAVVVPPQAAEASAVVAGEASEVAAVAADERRPLKFKGAGK